MSGREGYTVPNINPQGSFGGGAGSALASGRHTIDDEAGPPTQYICSDCAAKVQIRRKDALRCVECGGRVLYKERTKRCA